MKFTIKGIIKKISNLTDEMRFVKLKERSASTDFTEFHELAECYHKGIGTRRNYKQALIWYIKEAMTGDAEAQYALGMRYWKGEKLVGGERDEEEALRWIEMAADSGHKKSIAFIDENVDNDNLTKLQNKIYSFEFGPFNKTIRFIERIKDQSQREEFIHKAVDAYGQKGDISSMLFLLQMICDEEYRLGILLNYSGTPEVDENIKSIEGKALKELDGQIKLANAYERRGYHRKAFEILAISANKVNPSDSSTQEFISFVCRYLDKYEKDGEYENAKKMLDEARMKCVDFCKTSVYGDFIIRWSRKFSDTGNVVKAMELLESVSIVGVDVSSEKQRIAQEYEKEILDEAKKFESNREFKNAFSCYLKIKNLENGKTACIDFLLRWAKAEEELGEPIKAKNVLKIALSFGRDVTEELVRIDELISGKFGKKYQMIDIIDGVEDFEHLYEQKEQAVALGLEEEFKNKGQELLSGDIDNVEDLDVLTKLADLAKEFDLEDTFSEKKAELIEDMFDCCDDHDELAKLEKIAKENNAEEIFIKRMKEIIEDEIESCYDVSELENLEDIAVKYGLEDTFSEKKAELIEDMFDCCDDHDELAKLEKLAKENNAEEIFIKRMKEIVEDEIESCYDVSELENLEDIAVKYGLEDCYKKNYIKQGR